MQYAYNEFEDDDEDDAEPPSPTSPGYNPQDGYGKLGARAAISMSAGARAQGVLNAGFNGLNSTAGIPGAVARAGTVLHGVGSGVAAALGPVTAVTGPVGVALNLLESGVSIYSAVVTRGHLIKLRNILAQHRLTAMKDTVPALEYLIEKKELKYKRKALGGVPLIGPMASGAHALAHNISKRMNHTKGIERNIQARILWANHRQGCACATAVCKEILGMTTFTQIEDYDDGYLVLKKKLKSV